MITAVYELKKLYLNKICMPTTRYDVLSDGRWRKKYEWKLQYSVTNKGLSNNCEQSLINKPKAPNFASKFSFL